MALFDSLIWLVLALIVGGSMGMGIAKLNSFISKKRDQRNMMKVIQGTIPNNLKTDDKIINVKKFQYMENDGNIIKVNLGDIANKTQPRPLKDEKTQPLKEEKKEENTGKNKEKREKKQ